MPKAKNPRPPARAPLRPPPLPARLSAFERFPLDGPIYVRRLDKPGSQIFQLCVIRPFYEEETLEESERLDEMAKNDPRSKWG